MLQPAADMHPWTENDIVVQRPIARARNNDRVDEGLSQVERLGFAQVTETLLDQLAGDRQRANSEQRPDGERFLARRRALYGARRGLSEKLVGGCCAIRQ